MMVFCQKLVSYSQELQALHSSELSFGRLEDRGHLLSLRQTYLNRNIWYQMYWI